MGIRNVRLDFYIDIYISISLSSGETWHIGLCLMRLPMQMGNTHYLIPTTFAYILCKIMQVVVLNFPFLSQVPLVASPGYSSCGKLF